MLFKWFFILFYIILIMTKICRPENNINDNNNNNNKDIISYSWIKSFILIRNEVKNCIKDESIQSNITTWGKCLKVTIRKIFDDIMSSHIITIMDGVKLVKISSDDGNGHNKVDVDLLGMNNKMYIRKSTEVNEFQESDKKGFESNTWYENIWHRLIEILSKYVLQINILELENTSGKLKKSIVSGRYRRHHRNNMLLAMMFGVTALGTIMVPVGFQFLSMLSGKALLLAKMALLLASINGFKKIASSGLHYGLYHVPDHYGGFYDRGEPSNHQPIIQRNTNQFHNML